MSKEKLFSSNNRKSFTNAYYTSGTLLGTLHSLCYLTFTTLFLLISYTEALMWWYLEETSLPIEWLTYVKNRSTSPIVASITPSSPVGV